MSRRRPSAAILPDELIAEILSWLTVKPLMRFRCVSKSWNTLISDPTFVQMHLKRSARNPHLALMWNDQHLNCSVVPFPIRRLLENPSVTLHEDPCNRLTEIDDSVVGSCNGLLCLLGNSFSESEEYVDDWLCFWNPATRTRSEKFVFFSDFSDHLAFKFAFGYDNATETYKVVAFRVEGDEGDKASWRSEVRIFSLEDTYWRNIQCFPVLPLCWFDYYQSCGVHLNGTLNWLAIRNYFRSGYRCRNGYYTRKDTRKDVGVTVDHYVIVSLDLWRETYTQLLLPRGFDEVPCIQPTVGVLMDCLCFSHDFKGTDFVIWQMKDFGVQESWTQLLKISYQNLQIDDKFDALPLFPLCLSEKGDTLILANDEDDQAIIYNWRDSRVERTRITNKIQWFWANDYVESLVSTC